MFLTCVKGFDKIEFHKTDPKDTQFLDLKLGNFCNLKCRICGSWSSSKWASESIDYYKAEGQTKEYIENSDHYRQLKMGQWPRKNENNFWDDVEEILSRVKYFEFTGGEPLLGNVNYDIMKKLNKSTIIRIITNGTQNPSRLIKTLKGFKVHFVPGWDCHGLPIELKVLQSLKSSERKI